MPEPDKPREFYKAVVDYAQIAIFLYSAINAVSGLINYGKSANTWVNTRRTNKGV